MKKIVDVIKTGNVYYKKNPARICYKNSYINCKNLNIDHWSIHKDYFIIRLLELDRLNEKIKILRSSYDKYFEETSR